MFAKHADLSLAFGHQNIRNESLCHTFRQTTLQSLMADSVQIRRRISNPCHARKADSPLLAVSSGLSFPECSVFPVSQVTFSQSLVYCASLLQQMDTSQIQRVPPLLVEVHRPQV